VSAWWLLLTNHTVNFFVVFLLYCFFWSVIGLILIFIFSILLVGLFLVLLVSTIIVIVVISFHSHDATLASWHIFTCHNTLWLFKNSHNLTVCVVAVSLMPERVMVVFSAQWVFSIFEHNICNIYACHICLGYVMTDVFRCLFSHCGGLGSVPGWSVWDLWYSVALGCVFLLWVLHFFLIISFNQCSILICSTVTDGVYS